jgi:hypothetical protein
MGFLRSSRLALACAVAFAGAAQRAAAQVPAPEGGAPTPIEQALIEYTCRTPRQVMGAREPHDDCLRNELTALRGAFGRDLQQLAPAERRRIDAACSRVRDVQGRDAYLGCLRERLTALQAQTATASPGADDVPAIPASTAAAAPVEASGPGAPSTPARGSSRARIIAIAGLGVLGALGGAGFVYWQRRQLRLSIPSVPSLCRICGADVGGAGELCAACRHEAAETQRRAVAAEAERRRALVEGTAVSLEHQSSEAAVDDGARTAADGERRREATAARTDV